LAPMNFSSRNRDAIDLVFADHFVRPPAHAGWLGMLMGFTVDDDAAVKNASVFVEFPSVVVVALPRCAPCLVSSLSTRPTPRLRKS
jgi:hypothetical protein